MNLKYYIIVIILIITSIYAVKPDYLFDELWREMDGNKGFFFYKVENKILFGRLIYKDKFDKKWKYYGYRYQSKEIYIRGLTDNELEEYKKLTIQNREYIYKIFRKKYWSRKFKEWLDKHQYLKFLL